MMKNWILDAIFPAYCVVCHRKLIDAEQVVCLECEFELPIINQLIAQNPLHNYLLRNKLSPALPIEYINCLCNFSKEGVLQQLIHLLKYHQKASIGIFLGKFLGNYFEKNNFFEEIDYLVPVPLHPKRFKKRTYNQSLLLARGVQQVVPIPIAENLLIRNKNTTSQTALTSSQRQSNINQAFGLNPTLKHTYEGKHLLIMDDIITTGATLNELLKSMICIPNVRLSVLAVASNFDSH